MGNFQTQGLAQSEHYVNYSIPTEKWQASNLSSQYHFWIKCYSQEDKGNDLQLKKLMIVLQILLFSTIRNV